MRPWLTISAALVVSLFALHAGANGGGLAGKSGKDGQTCAQCHNGGAAPTVKLSGPPSLAAGASGDYELTITTTLAKASAGIATDTGKLTAGTGLKLDGTELTHSASIAAAGEAKFAFKLKAPTTGTKVKLYAAGLASDGTGTTGDADAKDTLEIAVTGGSTGPATAAGDDDDSTTSTSKNKSSSSSSGSGSGDDDDDENSTGIPNSGCAAAPEGTDALSGLGVLAALALVLRSTRRRST